MGFGPRGFWVLSAGLADFRLDFRISTSPTQGFWVKSKRRRWALCALPTPQSQARRAIHRTSLKAAVRAGALVCATSRGCRWVVSSAHPAREAAGPLALVPRLPPCHTAPTAPGWCLLLSHPPDHAHTVYTRGLWAPQVLCFLSLRGDLLVHRRPVHPACWRLQSPEPRFAHRTFSTHPACSMVIASAACALPGLPLVQFGHDATYT